MALQNTRNADQANYKRLATSRSVEKIQVRQETESELAERICGDWPAPCNCDDPTTHNGH